MANQPNDLERIHLVRINKVSKSVISVFQAFNNQEYYDVLVKVHQGWNTSEKIALDKSMSISQASAILSVLKRKGILKSAKRRDGRYLWYSFNTQTMRKIKSASKLNW